MASATAPSMGETTLTCPICWKSLKNPVTIATGCGHEFCLSCISDHWDREHWKREFSCPQCKRIFTYRPVLRKNPPTAEMDLKKPSAQAAGPGKGKPRAESAPVPATASNVGKVRDRAMTVSVPAAASNVGEFRARAMTFSVSKPVRREHGRQTEAQADLHQSTQAAGPAGSGEVKARAVSAPVPAAASNIRTQVRARALTFSASKTASPEHGTQTEAHAEKHPPVGPGDVACKGKSRALSLSIGRKVRGRAATVSVFSSTTAVSPECDTQMEGLAEWRRRASEDQGHQ